MVKKFNMKLFNTKYNVTYKHVEVLLIIITLIIGAILVFMFTRNINQERENLQVEKFQTEKKIIIILCSMVWYQKHFYQHGKKLESNSEIKTERYDVDLEENKQIAIRV